MDTSDSNKKGKSILSRICLDQFVAAIASLGDRSDHLISETSRLNTKTKSPSSLWGEIINKLGLDHNEKNTSCIVQSVTLNNS
jgi:hypothetical protein